MTQFRTEAEGAILIENFTSSFISRQQLNLNVSISTTSIKTNEAIHLNRIWLIHFDKEVQFQNFNI